MSGNLAGNTGESLNTLSALFLNLFTTEYNKHWQHERFMAISHLFNKVTSSKQWHFIDAVLFLQHKSITFKSLSMFSYIGNCKLDVYLQCTQGTCTYTCTWGLSTWDISASHDRGLIWINNGIAQYVYWPHGIS